MFITELQSQKRERDDDDERVWRGGEHGFDPFLTPYSHTLIILSMPINTKTDLFLDASLVNPQRPIVEKWNNN